MLDEVHLKACHMISIGKSAIEVAEEIGIARSTVYEWKKDDEFKATLEELGQEFISRMKHQGQSFAPIAMKKLQYLVEHGNSDKTQLDAASKIIDKYMSNATKIELDSNVNNDTVQVDILAKELKEFNKE